MEILLGYFIEGFDLFHLFVYKSLIKAIGKNDESNFDNVIQLMIIQFLSCIIMSFVIFSPFIILLYFYLNQKPKIIKNDSILEPEIKSYEQINTRKPDNNSEKEIKQRKIENNTNKIEKQINKEQNNEKILIKKNY